MPGITAGEAVAGPGIVVRQVCEAGQILEPPSCAGVIRIEDIAEKSPVALLLVNRQGRHLGHRLHEKLEDADSIPFAGIVLAPLTHILTVDELGGMNGLVKRPGGGHEDAWHVRSSGNSIFKKTVQTG